MAGNAADVILGMYRIDSIHVLRAARMAGQTPRVDLFRRSAFERKYFAYIPAACYVRRAWTVASLAPLPRRLLFCIESSYEVRRSLIVLVELLRRHIFMAGLANLYADVLGSINLSRSNLGRTDLRRCGRASVRLWNGLARGSLCRSLPTKRTNSDKEQRNETHQRRKHGYGSSPHELPHRSSVRKAETTSHILLFSRHARTMPMPRWSSRRLVLKFWWLGRSRLRTDVHLGTLPQRNAKTEPSFFSLTAPVDSTHPGVTRVHRL